jgi:hypothetical protein
LTFHDKREIEKLPCICYLCEEVSRARSYKRNNFDVVTCKRRKKENSGKWWRWLDMKVKENKKAKRK